MRKNTIFIAAVASVVFMAGCAKEPSGNTDIPVLNLDMTDHLELPAEGGTAYIHYELINPSAEGKLEASSPEDWLGDFKVASDSTIAFVVNANETQESRSAEIELRYDWPGGEPLIKTFTAVQDAGNADPAVEIPEIVVDENFLIPASGGDFEIVYEIVNPVEGGTLSVEAETGEWISNIVWNDRTVSFTAGENPETQDRTDVLKLMYEYGENDRVEATVSIVQAAAEEEKPAYDYEYELSEFWGSYENNTFLERHEFTTWILDNPFNGQGLPADGTVNYNFILYTAVPEDSANPFPTEGTYSLDVNYSYAEMTFAASFGLTASNYYPTNFLEGTLTVTKDGDNAVFDAVLLDVDSMTHHMVYTGPAEYEGGTESEEPDQPGGEDISYEATTATAYYNYGKGNDGSMYVRFSFSDVDYDAYTGCNIILLAYVPWDKSGAIAEETYTVTSEYGNAYTCEAGSGEGVWIEGSYATVYDGNSSKDVAITDGTMTVNGGSVVCKLTLGDGRQVFCTYNGTLTVQNVPSE